jgi:hypothetical protein
VNAHPAGQAGPPAGPASAVPDTLAILRDQAVILGLIGDHGDLLELAVRRLIALERDYGRLAERLAQAERKLAGLASYADDLGRALVIPIDGRLLADLLAFGGDPGPEAAAPEAATYTYTDQQRALALDHWSVCDACQAGLPCPVGDPVFAWLDKNTPRESE